MTNPNSTDTTPPQPPLLRAGEAQKLIEMIAELEDSIPFFTMPPAGYKSGRLNAFTGIPAAVLHAAAVAADNDRVLRAVMEISPNELRDALDYAVSHEGVAARLEALARGARHALDLQRARVGEETLQIYRTAQTLVRFGRCPHLVPHVRQMREALGRKGKKGPRTPEAPQTPG
jgi:hypothetical protein